MIQRFLYTVLQDGVRQITDDPSIIEDLFADVYCLSTEEIQSIQTYWANKPPKVIHGYAPREVELPVYSIVLDNESEAETWLNNDVGNVEDPEDEDFRADIKGSIWQHQYGILIYDQHPDATLYLYEIAKSIILSGNDYFVDQGLYDIDVSGMDLMLDPRYVPQHAFSRKVSFACRREFRRVQKGSQVGKIRAVDGLHIDRSGSPSDAGPVQTNIGFPPEYEGS